MPEEFWYWMFIIAVIAGLSFGVKSCVDHENTPEYRANQAAEMKDCETPKLVSEIDGLKLYVIRPNCDREVYFSRAGTHTTHTERHGKSTHTYDDDTSNGEKQ